jgi:hypothetical protein
MLRERWWSGWLRWLKKGSPLQGHPLGRSIQWQPRALLILRLKSRPSTVSRKMWVKLVSKVIILSLNIKEVSVMICLAMQVIPQMTDTVKVTVVAVRDRVTKSSETVLVSKPVQTYFDMLEYFLRTAESTLDKILPPTKGDDETCPNGSTLSPDGYPAEDQKAERGWWIMGQFFCLLLITKDRLIFKVRSRVNKTSDAAETMLKQAKNVVVSETRKDKVHTTWLINWMALEPFLTCISSLQNNALPATAMVTAGDNPKEDASSANGGDAATGNPVGNKKTKKKQMGTVENRDNWRKKIYDDWMLIFIKQKLIII